MNIYVYIYYILVVIITDAPTPNVNMYRYSRQHEYNEEEEERRSTGKKHCLGQSLIIMLLASHPGYSLVKTLARWRRLRR